MHKNFTTSTKQQTVDSNYTALIHCKQRNNRTTTVGKQRNQDNTAKITTTRHYTYLHTNLSYICTLTHLCTLLHVHLCRWPLKIHSGVGVARGGIWGVQPPPIRIKAVFFTTVKSLLLNENLYSPEMVAIKIFKKIL